MRTLMRNVLELVERHERFTYDLRGNCRVLGGSVAAYRSEEKGSTTLDLSRAIAHALERDGILGAWRDPETGQVKYDSCRVFTSQDEALRFAYQEEQRSIFNLNRMTEVPVASWLRSCVPAAAKRAAELKLLTQLRA